MASEEEQQAQNYLDVIQPGAKVVGIDGDMVRYQATDSDVIEEKPLASILEVYSKTPKSMQGTDRVKVISNPYTGENVFVEMLPSGRHRPLALSENPKMKTLGNELDAMGL